MQIPIKVWFFKFNSSVKLDDQFEKNPTVVLMPLINNVALHNCKTKKSASGRVSTCRDNYTDLSVK